MNKAKKLFTEGLSINNMPKINEDDVDYLREVCNYLFDSRTPQAVDTFKESVQKAKRNSVLHNLIIAESRSYLSGHDTFYTTIKKEEASKMGHEITESLNGKVYAPPGNLLIGSMDPERLKKWNKERGLKEYAVASHPFSPQGPALYVPALFDWVEGRIKSGKDSKPVREFLRYVHEAVKPNVWRKEVVINREDNEFGKIIEVIND